MKIETGERCNSPQHGTNNANNRYLATTYFLLVHVMCKVCDVYGLRVMNFLGI